MRTQLPSEFGSWAGRDVVKASNGVYHGPCPKCGGDDRFMWIEASARNKSEATEPFGQCRQCNWHWAGDMEESQSLTPLTDQERAEIARERERRRLEQEKRGIDNLAYVENHLGEWQQQLTIKHVDYWEKEQGISPEWQSYWRVGYTPEKKYSANGELHTSPAYVIPYFRQNGAGPKIVQCDFRLLSPCPKAGKYRPIHSLERKIFLGVYSEPFQPGDDVIIVEGSKKAMTLTVSLSNGTYANVIGVPAKLSWAGVEEAEWVQRAGRVFIWFDPDASMHDGESPMDRLARKIAESGSKAQFRVIETLRKPDDTLLGVNDPHTEFERLKFFARRAFI